MCMAGHMDPPQPMQQVTTQQLALSKLCFIELPRSKISRISCPTSGGVLFSNLPGQSQSRSGDVPLDFGMEVVLLSPFMDFRVKRQ